MNRAREGESRESQIDDDSPLNPKERKSFIDNLLVRIHLIIETILVHRFCAMGV